MPQATQVPPPARPAGFLHDMTQRLRVLETSPLSAANSQAMAGPVTGPNLADPPELPPLAKDQDVAAVAKPTPSLDPIATWLFDGHLNDESILAALQAPSTLQSALLQSTLQLTLGRKLQDDDKRHLVDLALANFSHLAFDKIDALVDRLVRDDPKIDPKVRRLVAERLLQHAVHPGDDAENPRAQARAFALYFARAMRDDPPGMAELLAQLPPQDGFRLARALGKEPLPDNRLTTRLGRQQDPRLNDAKLLCGVRNQILAALPRLPRLAAGTPAAISRAIRITALVYGLWDEITPADFQRVPGLAHNLAVAVADQWDPNNPPVDRVEGLLTSPAGARLMCSGSFGWRAAVHEAFRLNPGLSTETLARHGGEPENNPEVAAAITSQLLIQATAEEKAGAAVVTVALQTESGRKLLFNPDLSPRDRGAVVRIMLADRGKHLTRAAFAGTDDAWQLDGIAGPFAAQKLGNIEDGDFSSLSEIGKSNLAGLWQGKTPANMTEQDIRDAKDAVAQGKVPPYLNEKDFYPNDKDVKKFAGTDRLVVKQVMLFRNGPVWVPLLYGHWPNGSELILDQDGSDYRDGPRQSKNLVADLAQPAMGMRFSAFDNFLNENSLPEGGSVYFRRQGDKVSVLDHRETPASSDTTKKVAHGVARGTTWAAMIAAFVFTDGLAAAVLGDAALAGMGYLALEDAGHLLWLHDHGHDVTNPDQAVLATLLDMAANVLPPLAGVGGLAAAGLLSAEKAVLVTAGLELAAKGTNLAAFANQIYEMANNPEVKPEDWLTAGFFFWVAFGHGPRRPAAETPRLLETPNKLASAPATAEPVQPAPKPKMVTPVNRLQEPVKLPGKPVAPPTKLMNVKPKPASPPLRL
jgi:hypothetical protein